MTSVDIQQGRVRPLRPGRITRIVGKLEPFHANVGLGMNSVQFVHLDIMIPAGKRLVIESVTARADLPEGQRIMLSIVSKIGGRGAMHYIALVPQGTVQSMDVFAATCPIRIYADAQTELHFEAWRSAPMGVANVNVAVSGRYVPMP